MAVTTQLNPRCPMRRAKDSPLRLAFAATLSLLGTACGQPSTPAGGGTPAAASQAYTPGLGELMTLQQMRHTKLWLAGQLGIGTLRPTSSTSSAKASTTWSGSILRTRIR